MDDEMDRTCSKNGDDEECIQVIDGKVRSKEATMKIKTQVSG
jgi:hypothetical protein